jgi:DDE domain
MPTPSQSDDCFVARRRNLCEGEKGLDVPLSSGGLAIRNTLEFLLSPTRDAAAAKQFFQKALGATHTVSPRVITVDTNAAYPKAMSALMLLYALQLEEH